MRASAGGWIAASMLAWLAGVAVQLREPRLAPVTAYLAAALTALLLLYLAAWSIRRGPPIWRRTGACLAVAAVALASFGLTGLQASDRSSDALAPRLEGVDLVVVGIVASLPQQGPSGLRFRFMVDADSRRDRPGLPRLLTLGWYSGFHEDAVLTQPQRDLRAGQRWRFTVRLRRPHGNLNPNGFDYELQLFEQGVRATGYVRDAPPPRLIAENAGFAVERLRQRVRDSIYAHVDDRRAAGVLAALAVGDQGAIDHDDWDLFRNTGVAHLVSISGLHVTMFAWLAGLAVAALWRRSRRAMLALPAAVAARWGGLAAATGYAFFSGWGVPSQRTVWMLATVTLLQVSGVRWPWLFVLLASAVVVTAFDPWALTQAGFWLSFAAVGLLMASSPALATQAPATPQSGERLWPRRLFTHLRSDLRTQVVATLGLTPLTLVFFQQVSVVGFFANLVAIPVVTLIVTPLALLGVFVAPLWRLGALAVQGLDGWLAWLAGWPGAVWFVPVAPLWARVAGLVAAALLVMPLPWRARIVAASLALALLVPPRELPAPGQFDLLAADVGQGMAVVVRTHGHVLLFDSGPRYSSESDAGQRVLVPLMRSRGDDRIDLLMLSHRDLDHVGGAMAVLAGLDVRAVSSSLEPGHPIVVAAGSRAGRCESGQRWQWDGVDFEVLRPEAGDYARALKSNAMSCVVHVSGGGRSAILAGDIEREQEALLVARYGDALRSDVLLVPHHGSRTSSSASFIEAVRPRIAVVQAGYRNRFGHPAAAVLARYAERGITVVASPSCGAWQWSADDADAGRCERDFSRRYWHHGVARSPS